MLHAVSEPTDVVHSILLTKHCGRQLCAALRCIRSCRGITGVIELASRSEVLRRFHASGDMNAMQSFELIYPFFSLRLFIFRYRLIPRCKTSAKLMHKHICGYHHRSKNSKGSYKEQIVYSAVLLVTLTFSSILNPKASLSTLQCTPSTRSHRSEPEFNSNSTGLDLSASGIVRRTFWLLLSQVVSSDPHFSSIELI